MSTFKSPADAPFQIKTEGETISISFKSGLPVTGQGLVEWNFPVPAAGCAEGTRGAYGGMLIVISDTPLHPTQAPVDGVIYTADPTADPDMHAGDKIQGINGSSRVIGAFYECDTINQTGEATTSFVVSDVATNGNYYVAGYAVDCQGRYHTDGVRAYSDQYSGVNDPDTSAFQVVALGKGNVLPTDGTGLLAGFTYEFELESNANFPADASKNIVKVSIDGINASTYADLLKEINNAISLMDNPIQSPVAPNTGRFWWDNVNNQLALFNGTVHQIVTSVIIENTDPASTVAGDYWYDGTTLKQWDTASWNTISSVEYNESPTNLTSNDDYWFNGTDIFNRNGNTWCQETFYNQEIDPSIANIPTSGGVYWYDSLNGILYNWNLDTSSWEETYAITWDSDPTTFADGDHWFDLISSSLFIRDTGVWVEVPPSTPTALPSELRTVISETEPAFPVENLYWYKESTEELNLWNITNLTFDPVAVLVWENDPTDITTCDLWWNSTNDVLSQYDIVHSQWNAATEFTISEIDPALPVTMPLGQLWYVIPTMVLLKWNGNAWTEENYIDSLADPALPVDGNAWLNTTTNQWYVWSIAQWNAIDPIDTLTDPNMIASGALWFDLDDNILYERVGTNWLTVPYSTTMYTPTKNDIWFDTTENQLMKWNGTNWEVSSATVTATLNANGHLQFTTSFKGTNACVMILVPEGANIRPHPSEQDFVGRAAHDFFNYGIYESVSTSISTVAPDTFLFDFLTPESYVVKQEYGTDGVSSTPSYDTIGVGDDGSPDERRNLADRIMQQLGAPTVDVEITPAQMNICIDLALSELRSRSSLGYKRSFFFLSTDPSTQVYKLTDKLVGFNKIVSIMGAHRMTSAFLSSAGGAGVYGQVVLQQLYSMGTFDLLSFHLISEYIEQMEALFATRITYNWDEYTRKIHFHQRFGVEKLLIDAMIEKTEQELLQDRWTKNWLERYAYAETMRILSQIRGKFASLPGAGGGISLNANDLITQHDMIKDQLLMEIEDYIVNDVEEIGLGSTFVIG